MSVEEDKDGPRVRVEWLEISSGKQVHVTGERNVLEHQKKISHGQGAEDPIDSSPPQFPLTQDENVDDVGQTANHTNEDRQVTVYEVNIGSNFVKSDATTSTETVFTFVFQIGQCRRVDDAADGGGGWGGGHHHRDRRKTGQLSRIVEIIIQILFCQVGGREKKLS